MQEVGPKGGKQDCETWGAAGEMILSAAQLLGVQTSSSSWDLPAPFLALQGGVERRCLRACV